ncbi:glycosyltransferase [Microbacterium lacticum]
MADNCTDRTVEVARRHGADVFETVGNTHKKGGALNQALTDLLPTLGDNDTVMVMDADSQIGEDFLAEAARRFTDDRAQMAVGGLFEGEDGHGLIGQFQRNEYIRYQREIRRRRGRVFVLTGTASVFRSAALREVAAARGEHLPGIPGEVYDTLALTEDNELTIAIKSLGGLTISPTACSVITELMPHLADAVGAAPALAARRAREPRRIRCHAADHALLGPADRHRLRRDGAVRLLRAADHHDPHDGHLGVVPVLDPDRPAVRRRARDHRMEWRGVPVACGALRPAAISGELGPEPVLSAAGGRSPRMPRSARPR